MYFVIWIYLGFKIKQHLDYQSRSLPFRPYSVMQCLLNCLLRGIAAMFRSSPQISTLHASQDVAYAWGIGMYSLYCGVFVT